MDGKHWEGEGGRGRGDSPVSKPCGVVAFAFLDGTPSYTMTRSARYVAYAEVKRAKSAVLKRVLHTLGTHGDVNAQRSLSVEFGI